MLVKESPDRSKTIKYRKTGDKLTAALNMVIIITIITIIIILDSVFLEITALHCSIKFPTHP